MFCDLFIQISITLLLGRKTAPRTPQLPLVPLKGFPKSHEFKTQLEKKAVTLWPYLSDWKKAVVAEGKLVGKTLQQCPTRSMQVPQLPLPDLGDLPHRSGCKQENLVLYLASSQINWMCAANVSNRGHEVSMVRILLVMASELEFWLDETVPFLMDSGSNLLELMQSILAIIRSSKYFDHHMGLFSIKLNETSDLSQYITVEPKMDDMEGDDQQPMDVNPQEEVEHQQPIAIPFQEEGEKDQPAITATPHSQPPKSPIHEDDEAPQASQAIVGVGEIDEASHSSQAIAGVGEINEASHSSQAMDVDDQDGHEPWQSAQPRVLAPNSSPPQPIVHHEQDDPLENVMIQLLASLKGVGVTLPRSGGKMHPIICNLVADFLHTCQDVQQDVSLMERGEHCREIDILVKPSELEVYDSHFNLLEQMGANIATVKELSHVLDGGELDVQIEEGSGSVAPDEDGSVAPDEDGGVALGGGQK